MTSTHGWRKSRYSGTQPNCVEVQADTGMFRVRDSKDPAGAVLSFPHADWKHFNQSLRRDELNRR